MNWYFFHKSLFINSNIFFIICGCKLFSISSTNKIHSFNIVVIILHNIQKSFTVQVDSCHHNKLKYSIPQFSFLCQISILYHSSIHSTILFLVKSN